MYSTSLSMAYSTGQIRGLEKAQSGKNASYFFPNRSLYQKFLCLTTHLIQFLNKVLSRKRLSQLHLDHQ